MAFTPTTSNSDGRVRGHPGFNKKELDVITACVKECGLNYVDVLNAAYTETGKMAILADANASFLGKVVQTTQTRGFIKRWKEPVKSVVHVEQGLGHQKLKDDKLFHQTTVEHTSKEVYEKNKSKRNKEDGLPAYHSADVCAVQLGFSSHLSAYTNQVAGVMLLDGARSTTEQAVIAVGVIPLYKAVSHALFFPRLCIDYEDESFMNRLQLVTTFSDDVKGTGHTALSYSSLSVVRHNKVDPCWLPEALPWDTIEKKFPLGVQSLQNFQATEINALEPAKLTRSASYMPLCHDASNSVLTWDSAGATIRQSNPLLARNNISFEGMSYGLNPARAQIQDNPARCPNHNKVACPCAQHNGVVQGSGPSDSATLTGGLETAIEAFRCTEPELFEGFQDIGTITFSVPVNSIVGTTALRLPIDSGLLKGTSAGRAMRGISWVSMSMRFRLTGSASMQSKGLFYLCYDPNDTLTRYPSRDRALMLQGVYFMPGRYDSVDFDLPHIATPAGFTNLDESFNGFIKVVLLDSLVNMEVAEYCMDIQMFAQVHHTIPQPVLGPPLCTSFLPLRHCIMFEEISTILPKGTCYTIPLHPVYPANDGAQLYPSVSSSVLEAHSYWKGELEIEIVFSLPSLSGGLAILSVSQSTWNGASFDDFVRHGCTRMDLRAQRICRMRVNMQAWTGLNTAGRGSLFGHDPQSQTQRGARLNIFFPGPPIITDTHKKGSFLVRYIGIHNPELFTPVISQTRTGPMKPLTSADGMKAWEWQDIQCTRIKDLFVKPRSFRMVTYTSWAPSGWLHIPCTPCCFVPSFAGSFKGEMEPLNYLSHRSQENAMWRGTLKYYIKVVRSATKAPINVVTMTAYPNEGLATTPGYTEKNEYVVPPVMSKSGTFLSSGTDLVAEIVTPGDKWYWTRYGAKDEYTREFHPQWLSLQFPSLDNLQLECSIDLYIEADVEYQFPIPPFPLAITTKLPEYYWKNNLVVS